MWHLQGKSLCIFSSKNLFRRICSAITSNVVFKSLIFLLIIFSTVNLALQLPLSDPNSQYNTILNYIDLGLSLAFVVECLLKIVSRGFLCNGTSSYLRNPWSQMDFAIVVLSMLSFVSSQDTRVTKLLRNLRVVRPLRMIAKNQGLKIAVQSLVNSIKGIANITVITLFVFFVWGIFGVNFFKGLYYFCDQTATSSNGYMTEISESVESKWDCINAGGEWYKEKNNFDNFLYAAFTLYQISTSQMWREIMFIAMDSTQIDYMPQENDFSSPSALYFIFFIFIGGLFIMNLFQCQVISIYMAEKEKLSNNHHLTEMQREWARIQILCYKSQPLIINPKGQGRLRKFMLMLTNHKYFEGFIQLCIVLNTIIIACNWYEMPNIYEIYLQMTNNALTFVFLIEAILKIIAEGIFYFKKAWNNFDMIILIATLSQIIVSFINLNNISIEFTVVRVLKFLRTLSLVKNTKSLENIAITIFSTIPQLMNITLLLFLLMVFYAIMGMNIFGRVKFNGELTDMVHFQTFSKAFLTMMKCATGEGWNTIMFALMSQRTITFQCIPNPSYSDILQNNGEGVACGSYWPALLFFLTYQMIVCRIFLNLFIAVILEGFDDSKQNQSLRVSKDMLLTFQNSWALYDQEGTGFISIKDLQELLSQLIISKTNWIRGGEHILNNQRQMKHFLSLMELPMYNKFSSFSYYDILNRLTQTIFKVDFDRFVMLHQHVASTPAKMYSGSQQIVNTPNTIKSTPNGQKTPKDVETQIQEDQIKDNDDLSWMQVRDHLIFETFEEFYEDLREKLEDTHLKIALNLELVTIHDKVENRLIKTRSHYDSRILTLVPHMQRQLRLLVTKMRQKRLIHSKEIILQHISKEIMNIPETVKTKLNQYTAKLAHKKREDFFQILAKTADEQALKERKLNSKSSVLKNKKVKIVSQNQTPISQSVKINKINKVIPSEIIKTPRFESQNSSIQDVTPDQSKEQADFIQYWGIPDNNAVDLTQQQIQVEEENIVDKSNDEFSDFMNQLNEVHALRNLIIKTPEKTERAPYVVSKSPRISTSKRKKSWN